jgi:CO/xanthine dehydrogenase Mo-binding subunit
VIGASPRRKEDRRLLVGAGRYLDDVTREGLLHLGVVRSAHAHARVLGVDVKAALALPGVVAAWTAADLPEVAPTIPPSYGGTAPKGKFWAQPVLARDVVRYAGEPIAVVVAHGPYLLADALDAIGVEYEPLSPVATIADALAASTPMHEGWGDNTTLAVGAHLGATDPSSAAAVVVRERFRHARLSGSAIEPRGAVAYPEPGTDALVLYSSHQNPYLLRDGVATALRLPSERVRVVVPDVGGGFGPKGMLYPEDILVAAAARRLGRPVKWVEGRREHMLATGHDREQEHEATIAFAGDGRIAAIDETFRADVGAYPTQGDGLTANTLNHLPGPYRVPNYRCAGVSVVTNKTQNAAYRAAGRPEAVFVMERLMDLGARRLGVDPAELRRRNLVRPEEMPYRPGLTYKDGVPIAYDPGDFPASFERCLALLDYAGWRRRQTERAGARRVGVGVACYAQGTGLGPYEGANVRVDPSGRVYVTVGVAGQGQGHATTLAQVCAQELGAALEDVVVVAGDTSQFPFGMGTGGSRVTANAGPAVAATAREVRSRAAIVAAEALECSPADIRVEASRAFVVGMPSRAVTLGRLAHAAIKSKALKQAAREPGLNACTYFYPDTVTWAFGCQGAVVEVDVETCAIRLLAYAIVHDPGRAINPAIVEGQLHGGAVQGIGAGLMEEVVYDATGQLLSGSLMDYAIPHAADVPALAVALTEHASVINPLGVKGVGESGCIPGAPAIASAIEDAVADLGVVLREVPVTPARLFAALREARERAGGTPRGPRA